MSINLEIIFEHFKKEFWNVCKFLMTFIGRLHDVIFNGSDVIQALILEKRRLRKVLFSLIERVIRNLHSSRKAMNRV